MLTQSHGRPAAMATVLTSAPDWLGSMTLMLIGSPSNATLQALFVAAKPVR